MMLAFDDGAQKLNDKIEKYGKEKTKQNYIIKYRYQ